MKWKSTLVLLLLTIGVGTYVSLYDLKQPTSGERERRAKRIMAIDPAAATRLTLTMPSGVVTLERRGDVWRLSPEGVRADETRVSGLLDALNPLTAERVLTGTAGRPLDEAAFGLSPAVGSIAVTAEGRTTTLQFGDAPAVGGGRYVKLVDQPQVYVVRTTALDDADQPRPLYRDPLLLRFPSWAAEALRVTAPDRAFSIERREDAWQITAPLIDQADRGEVTTLLNRLAGLRVERFLDETPAVERVPEYGFDHPTAEITLTTQGPPPAAPGAARTAVTTTVFIGKPMPDAAGLVYAKRSDEPALYAVAASEVQALLADPHGLRAKSCFNFFAGEVAKVELRQGEAGWTAVKRDGHWVEGTTGAGLAAEPIASFLSTAADLRLSGFLEEAPADVARYGLEPPRATIAIWPEGTEQPQRLLVGDPIEQTQSRYGRIEGRQAVVRLPESVNALITAPEPAPAAR